MKSTYTPKAGQARLDCSHYCRGGQRDSGDHEDITMYATAPMAVPPPTPRTSEHKPRILLLYGSPHERSFSRLLVEEAARLLEHFGIETHLFDPSSLPLPDDAPVGAGAARPGAVVGRPGVVLPRTPRRTVRGIQGADRLDSPSAWRRPPHAGQDASGNSQRISEVFEDYLWDDHGRKSEQFSDKGILRYQRPLAICLMRVALGRQHKACSRADAMP